MFKPSEYSVNKDGCHIWQKHTCRSGYGIKKYKGYPWRAHRLSWIFSFGEIPSGLFVLHKCDVRACINPDHLFLGTNQDNVDDRERKGRGNHLPATENPNRPRKLLCEDVRAIRLSSASPRELAKAYGVHRATIYRIRNFERQRFS